MARREWKTAVRAATAKALTGIFAVIVLVALVMFGLWVWHSPAPPHVPAYYPGSDRANPWGGR